jgi:hypothetical protein
MSDTTTPDLSPEEIAALQEENERLRRQVSSEKRRPTARLVIAVIVALLAIVAVAAAVDAVWLETTLQEEEQFVSTLTPLPSNDDVATAMSIRVADGVIEASEFETRVTSALPEGLEFAAGPLTSSVRDFVAGAAKDVLQSDAVATAWTTTLRVTHTAASAVLSGNDAALVAEGGQVAIDLDEIATVVVERVEAAGIELPEVEAEFGTIVIYEADQLAAAQEAAQAIDTLGWLVPLIAALLIAAAVAIAPDRRWMASFLGFGVAIGVLINLAALRIAQGAMLSGIEDQITRDAAEAAWDTLASGLRAGSWGVIILALIVGFVAWAMGPSPRARAFMSTVTGTVEAWQRPAEAEPSAFATFLAGSKRTIQTVVVILGLLFLLFGPVLTALRVIAVAVIVIVIVVLVEVFAGPAERPAEAPADEAMDDREDTSAAAS